MRKFLVFFKDSFSFVLCKFFVMVEYIQVLYSVIIGVNVDIDLLVFNKIIDFSTSFLSKRLS